MKIESIKNYLLTNALHLQFVTAVINLIVKFGQHALKIAAQYDIFRACVEKEDIVYKVIRMKKKIILSTIVLTVLVSCNRMDFFTTNTVEIKNFKQEKRLVPITLIGEEYGHNNIACIDKYIVLFSSARDRFFHVYSAAGDSLGCFGIRGQGPADFVGVQWNGQSSGIGMWINDVNASKLRLVNIEKSLSERTTVMDKIVQNASFSINAFVRDDSLLISEQMSSDGYILVTTNLNNGQQTNVEKLYNYPVQNDFVYAHRSHWRLKPDGSKMAGAMLSINMINILDLTDNSRISLVINPPLTDPDNILEPNASEGKMTYYIDLDLTDNYIYALFMNQNYEEAYGVAKEMEVHVFDWKGNAKCKYIIPQYIRVMAVDEKNNCIYGLVEEDESDFSKIYKYNME
jgi:hypothetical protein